MRRRVLTVIMDGIGVRNHTFGNAVSHALTPAMHFLQNHGLYTTLGAHGPWVGLPSKDDIGNSEVGHNAIGAGRVFAQGASLVSDAIKSGALWANPLWQRILTQTHQQHSTLHFIGLLSDGNVHSHDTHLHAMLQAAARARVAKIRLHILWDGRDVAAHSAEVYLDRLQKVMADITLAGIDIAIASGGGRMHITMDRYEADWSMVERGWNAHVLGQADHIFSDAQVALKTLRDQGHNNDQYLPSFVVADASGPIGKIHDQDAVILFNFRGDRAIEICRAFTEKNFSAFDRQFWPQVLFAGMTCYDGDLAIPEHYLVTPPAISDGLSEYLVSHKVRQFACSETQKFGHVTYFWNGNRSGYIDRKLETYVEIPSDNIPFELKPWMKAHEITDATIQAMHKASFDFGRINYANGDMVGHTGDFEAATLAVATVDAMLKRLILAAQQTKTILLITADHGNCEEMFDAKAHNTDSTIDLFSRPKPKTAHTLAQVPCYIYDPLATGHPVPLVPGRGLASLANTTLQLMGLPVRDLYEKSLFHL
jgi:2,3-bisphosphoglycerate-independent phosphoglycerate mutase